MGTIKFAIGLGGIALALAVLFLSFNKFAIPTINQFSKSAGSALDNLGKNVNDFFNSFENNSSVTTNSDGTVNHPDFEQYNKDVKQKEIDAKNAGYDDITQYEKDTDPNNDPSKFNPPNSKYNENNPYGYDDYSKGKTNKEKKSQPFIFGIPEAYGEESQIDIGYTKPKSHSNKGKTTISGTVRSELDTNQQFQAYSSDSSKPVRGIIRETPQDPRKLQTDSKKNPTETASERASRVYEETGKFAGEGRGYGITPASEKTKNYKFGTNTGSSLKVKTTGKNAKLRLADKKNIENQKSILVFDSGSISNW